MRNLATIVKDLAKKEKNWQNEKLIDLFNGSNGDLISELLDCIKESIIKSGKDKTYEEVEKNLESKELMQEIISLEDYALQPFYVCEAAKVKNMDDISAKMLFETIFTNGIVRYDMKMFKSHAQFNIDEKTMTDLAEAFLDLAYKGVVSHYSRETMEYKFESETRLDKKYAGFFGELFERYYKELQLNYIIENIIYQMK